MYLILIREIYDRGKKILAAHKHKKARKKYQTFSHLLVANNILNKEALDLQEAKSQPEFSLLWLSKSSFKP
jgi:hypothetical protein